MNPIKTFKKLKLLYDFISLKNRINSYNLNFDKFGAYINEDYIYFDKYAYYHILITPQYTAEYILHIFCNNKYIIFRKDEINNSDCYNPKNYIIIKTKKLS